MRGLATTALCFAAACLSTPAAAQDVVYDPWEGTNRRLYDVHDSIDRAVLEPVARGYRAVTNAPVRSGVSNFLRNLRAPVVFVNDVLQGEARRAGVTAARFGVNTTVGFLGVLDPAETMGLERHDEDFGQTLAVWGAPAGPYLFVPVLGPTNVRDGAGRIVDIAFHPLTWAEFEGDAAVSVSRGVVGGVAARESLIETVEDVRATSLDPYVSIRTSHGLLRDSAIHNGRAAAAPEINNEFGGDGYNPIETDFDTDFKTDFDWNPEPYENPVTPDTRDEPATVQEELIGELP